MANSSGSSSISIADKMKFFGGPSDTSTSEAAIAGTAYGLKQVGQDSVTMIGATSNRSPENMDALKDSASVIDALTQYLAVSDPSLTFNASEHMQGSYAADAKAPSAPTTPSNGK